MWRNTTWCCIARMINARKRTQSNDWFRVVYFSSCLCETYCIRRGHRAANSRKTVRGLSPRGCYLLKRNKQPTPKTHFHIEGFFIVKYAWGDAKKQPGWFLQIKQPYWILGMIPRAPAKANARWTGRNIPQERGLSPLSPKFRGTSERGQSPQSPKFRGTSDRGWYPPRTGTKCYAPTKAKDNPLDC